MRYTAWTGRGIGVQSFMERGGREEERGLMMKGIKGVPGVALCSSISQGLFFNQLAI
jgi:hypothetical protein